MTRDWYNQNQSPALLTEGDISFKSSYLHEFLLYKQKLLLIKETGTLGTLLYERFIHLT